VLQASEGGRVYLGRSALEISLREAPALAANGSIPVPVAAIPTERISRPALAEVPEVPDVIEKGVLIGKSTLAGLCLTAFACGIIATVAIDHRGGAPVAQAPVAHAAPAPETTPVAAPAPQAIAEAPSNPAPGATASVPVVVQMAATPAAAPESTPQKAAPTPAVAAARAARPSVVARTPPVRRHVPPAGEPGTGTDAPPSTPPAAAKWVDPFAQ
jgi:hypothetical protein